MAVPIDASGVSSTARKVNGVADLRAVALQYSPQFVRVVTEKLMIYALGRGAEYYDMPLVRAIVRDAEPEQLPVLVARARHGQEPAVPDEH